MYIFFDFDSTVITQESLDEVIACKLGNHPEKEILITKIDQITNQGMNGSMPFTESAVKRFEVIKLKKEDFETVGKSFVKNITPGMEKLFEKLQKNHKVFVISGGFLPSLYAVTDYLQIPRSQVLANDVVEGDSGFVSPDQSSPMWTNEGKGDGIAELIKRNGLNPSKTVLIGDGANDLNTFINGQVDEFIGFGVNVVRENVKTNSPHFITTMEELTKVFIELKALQH